MPAGEQVGLEQPLRDVLVEDLDDPALVRQVLVDRQHLALPGLRRDLVHVVEPVAGGLVGAEDPEVERIAGDDVAQPAAEHAGRLGDDAAAVAEVDRVDLERLEAEVATEQAAVRVRVRAHPPVALGTVRLERGGQAPVAVEQLVRAVALQPLLELAEVVRVVADAGQRHLVRTPRALDLLAVDLLRAGPALGRAEDQHRPGRSLLAAARAGRELDPADVVERLAQREREPLVHRGVVLAVEAARDDPRGVAVTGEEREQLLLGDAREDRGVRDLPAVEVEDRQHRAVGLRVEELVEVPAGGERRGLRLAVADHARDHEVGVVERGAEGVHERVAELAALVDGSGRLRRRVRRHPAGERELAEQVAHARAIRRRRREQLRVRAVEVRVRDHARAAVAGTGDVDHVEVALDDRPVEVRVDEVEQRGRAPVPEEARLDVVAHERPFEQRVVEQVDLAAGEVVGGAPPAVHDVEVEGRGGVSGCGVGGHASAYGGGFAASRVGSRRSVDGQQRRRGAFEDIGAATDRARSNDGSSLGPQIHC